MILTCKMYCKVPYLGIFILAGLLILHVSSQQCEESVQSSVQPCMMVIVSEFSTMPQSNGSAPSMNMLMVFCKPEVKKALICIFEAMKACPALQGSISSFPGMANIDMNMLDTMCSSVIDYSAQEVCLMSVINSTRYMSCLMASAGMADQDPCKIYSATVMCSQQQLHTDCPSVADAYMYSLKLYKPPGCPDVPSGTDDGADADGPCSRAEVQKYSQCSTSVVLRLSQMPRGSANAGMDSLAAALGLFCGNAKADLTCFLEGYEKYPEFKSNSDKAGLTMMFQPVPLKDFLMNGCKNIKQLTEQSECMSEQFESPQFENCTGNAQMMYPGPDSPTKPVSCGLYNAMMTCLHDNVGKNCNHGVADYMVKWSRIMFRTEEGCTTATAPTILSSIFLVLALIAAIFIL